MRPPSIPVRQKPVPVGFSRPVPPPRDAAILGHWPAPAVADLSQLEPKRRLLHVPDPVQRVATAQPRWSQNTVTHIFDASRRNPGLLPCDSAILHFSALHGGYTSPAPAVASLHHEYVIVLHLRLDYFSRMM